MYENEGHFASLGCLGISWEGLGELFGVLGASGGGPWRGLGESWKALEAKLIKRSQLPINVFGPFFEVKNGVKIIKNRFQKRSGLRRVSVNAFGWFVMNWH